MKKRNKVIIVSVIAWFIVSWPFLIAIGFKPKGSRMLFRLVAKQFLNPKQLPDPLILSDFESGEDMGDWHYPGIQFDTSSEFFSHGEKAGKLKFLKVKDSKEEFPGVISEDYILGPGGQRDWSLFHFFDFDLFNPGETEVSLFVKIKDVHGFQYQRTFTLNTQEKYSFSLDLNEIKDMLDLKNMAYLKIFLLSPKEEVVLFLDNIRLREKVADEIRLSGKPFLELVKVEYSQQVHRGEEVEFTFYFKTGQKLIRDYEVFVHLVPALKMGKGLRFIRGQINADFYPEIPTTKWRTNTTYLVGPIRVFIPQENPKGEYCIRAGLVNPEQKKVYVPVTHKFLIAKGPYDFSENYPKLRYKDKGIKNYIVGKFLLE